MKKRKFIVLAALPILMTGCTSTGTSSPSSEKPAPVSSSEPASDSSSTGKQESTSSSQSGQDMTLSGLKKMANAMAKQSNLAMTSTNSNISIDFKGKTTTKYSGVSETQEDESTPFYLKADLTKFNTEIAVMGLDKTAVSDFKASLTTKGNISATYNFTSSDTADNKTASATNAAFFAYVKNGTAYADVSDEALSKFVLGIMGQDNNPMPKSLGKYKLGNVVSTGPGLSADKDEVDSAVEEFYAQYKGTSGLNTFMNLHSDEDYSYIDFTITPQILKSLPAVYLVVAMGQLDQTDPNYKEKLDEVTKTSQQLTEIVNKTTVNSFDISIAYTDSGIHHINNDIDLTIKDYTYTPDSTTSLSDDSDLPGGGMVIAPQEVTIDNLKLAFNSKYTFKYGTAVKVADPGADKDYTDLSALIGGIGI